MKPFFLSLLLLLAGSHYSLAQQLPRPVPIIFDTDIGPDYDDVGAIALLHALADSGEARILATIASNKYARVGAVLSVFNTWFQRPGLPIGVPTGKALDMPAWQKWDSVVTARYPHNIFSNTEVPDAVALYRQLLAAEPDASVTIVTVGFFTNLANLLQSAPDKYSPLSGIELVKKKVKRLVSMAGHFPAGKEFNVDRDIPSSKTVVTNGPAPLSSSDSRSAWKC